MADCNPIKCVLIALVLFYVIKEVYNRYFKKCDLVELKKKDDKQN
jgi:hypothetical protein